jgi:hypothetical protein
MSIFPRVSLFNQRSVSGTAIVWTVPHYVNIVSHTRTERASECYHHARDTRIINHLLLETKLCTTNKLLGSAAAAAAPEMDEDGEARVALEFVAMRCLHFFRSHHLLLLDG